MTPRSMEGGMAGFTSPKEAAEATASSGHPVPLFMESSWEAGEWEPSPPEASAMGQKRLPPLHKRKVRRIARESPDRNRVGITKAIVFISVVRFLPLSNIEISPHRFPSNTFIGKRVSNHY